MEALASQALAALKAHGTTVDTKLKYLGDLKQEIKHRHCPEAAISPLFQCIKIALATPHLVDAGFSILGHLTKRLSLQNQTVHLHNQTLKLFPVFIDRLGDQKDRNRQRAIAAVGDFYSLTELTQKDAEQFMRDTVLASKHSRAKQSAMQWVVMAHTEKGMLFRAFVPGIVNCLEDADGETRHTAQNTVVSLFKDASIRSKQDLQKRMQERGVRKSIESHVLSELGLSGSGMVRNSSPHENSSPPSVHKRNDSGPEASRRQISPVEVPFPEMQPLSIAEQEAAGLSSLYLESPRDLEDTFREIQTWFEGKEAENNWLKREKSIEKLRRITKGNAPQEYSTLFLANIKGMLDGILKAVNSLRTTLCTIGCHLVQDLARVCGSGLDNMVEMLLQNLIKLCGNTKKISATKANDTVLAIMAHVSYHIRILQHINLASQDKNVQPRTFATQWLKVVLTRHGPSKHAIEHTNGLELIEKSIKTGLNDSNPAVRESMRGTYWSFAKIWPDRSETILLGLSQAHQDMLIKNAANPNPLPGSKATSIVGGGSVFSKSLGASTSRPSIKDTIVAQKRAQAAGRNLPERPGSAADSLLSPAKNHAPPRPATAMSSSRHASSTSTGTLSSAPVRPRRRPDLVRPATIDAAGSKTPKAETPRKPSPHTSPPKTARPKTPGLAASAMKFAPKKAASPAGSAAKSVRPKPAMSPETSPTRAAEDFTMVIPSLNKGVTTALSEEGAEDGTALAQTLARMDERASTQETHPARPLHMASPSHIPRMSPQVHDNKRKTDNQRLSMSPRDVVGRKESMQPKATAAEFPEQPKPLRVYEDPINEQSSSSQHPNLASPQAQGPIASPQAQRALGELPISSPATQNRIAGEHQLIREIYANGEPDAYHKDWKNVKQAEYKRVSAAENVDNPMLARKLLDSGIVRIQARSLDMHGFRKLQSLISSAPESVWAEGQKLQELLLPLLEQLESPPPANSASSDTRAVSRAQDIKTQILVVIKLLMATQPDAFQPFYPATLSSLIAARKHHSPASHIVAGLEESAEDCVARCADPNASIAAVLDLADVDHATPTQTMSLYVLAGLLHRCHQLGPSAAADLPRLGNLARGFLDSTSPDIRRAVIELVMEMRYNVTPREGEEGDEKFWQLLRGTRGEHRGLIMYYLARHRAVHT